MERFTKLEKVGEGTFGVVYKGEDKVTKEIVAIKKIRLEADDGDGIPSSALREIVLLKSLRHPNIVCLRDVLYNNQKLHLILEFVDNDLKKYLDGMGSVDVASATLLQAYFIRQLFTAVDFCHGRGFMHRDLKPHNILVNRQGTLKLADFGQGRMFDKSGNQTWTHEVCTIWYRAPEILMGSKQYSPSIDIWSMGCICAEILTRKPLLTGDSEIDQLFRIFRQLGTPSEELWPGVTALANYTGSFPKWSPQPFDGVLAGASSSAIDLVSRCLVLDPTKRITAREALAHPYFDDLRKVERQQQKKKKTGKADPLYGVVADLTAAIDQAQQCVDEYKRQKEIEKQETVQLLLQ